MRRKVRYATKKGTGKACRTPECDNEAVYIASELCHACYQYVWNYCQKGPTAIAERDRALRRNQARLASLSPVAVSRTARSARRVH